MIYLVRHGEVENKQGVLLCRLPGFHLSKKGQARIKEVALQFCKIGFKPTKIYASPLERTVESAQILADCLGIAPENIIKEKSIIKNNWQTVVDDYMEKGDFYKLDFSNNKWSISERNKL